MAEIKISQLPVTTSLLGDEVVTLLQNGINKRLTLTAFLKNLNSLDDIKINPLQNAIRTVISSKNITNLIYVDGVNDKIGIGTNTLTSHLLTINGNISYGSSTSNGVLVGSSEEVSWASGSPTVALSVSRQSSYLSVQAGFAGVFSLASGYDGQIKTITLETATTGNTTVAATGINSTFSTISFSAKGQGVTLVYKNSGTYTGWSVVGNNGCTFS